MQEPFLELIHSIVVNGNKDLFDRIKVDYLKSSASPKVYKVYNLLSNYILKHSALPTPTIYSNICGYTLSKDIDSSNEHIDQLFVLIEQDYLCKALSEYLAKSSIDPNKITREQLASNINFLSELVNTNDSGPSIITFGEAIEETLKTTKSYEKSSLLYTGYPSIDLKIGSIENQDLLVIAGRPGIGKSYLLLQLVHNIVKQDKRVLLVSLEMSYKQLTSRLMSIHTGISPKIIRDNVFTPEEKELVNRYYNEILPKYKENIIFIKKNSKLKFREFEYLVKQHQADVLVVDASYKLVEQDTSKSEDWQKQATIARNFAALSRNLNVPSIIASQLNRSADDNVKKKQKRNASEMAFTDALMQEASYVFTLHKLEELEEDNYTRIVTALKAREGESGFEFEINFIIAGKGRITDFSEKPTGIYDDLTGTDPQLAYEENEMVLYDF